MASTNVERTRRKREEVLNKAKFGAETTEAHSTDFLSVGSNVAFGEDEWRAQERPRYDEPSSSDEGRTERWWAQEDVSCPGVCPPLGQKGLEASAQF